MKHILATLIITFNFLHTNAQNPIPQQKSIDSIFANWNFSETPGASLGIIKNGELIYSKGYGSANLEYNIPNTSHTVFRIASTSKQFTAACIILLSQQGKLSLDDNLTKFFPSFPTYANEITIQHLLNHTSGIRDYLSLAQLSGLENEDHYTDKTVEKWLVNQEELNFKPGDEYLYSNSGYWLLGQIVNNVSGISMAQYAVKHLFKPLEMNSTHFHDNHKKIVKNRATGYAPNSQNGFSISMTTLDMVGDGGVFTTIEDLKKWDDAFYDSKFLDKNFWDKMTSVGTLNNDEKITYASGLGIDNYKGLKIIQHGGAFVGYRAEMIRFPEHRFSVILLANRADANPTRMAYQVADLFLKDKFKQESTIATNISNDSNKETDFNAISLSTNELKFFEGFYWNNESKISRKLEVRNDTLNYIRSNGRATKMVPSNKNKFQWFGPNIPITLKTYSTANSKGFTLDIPGETKSNFISYTPLNSYSSDDLKTYSGNYYSPELDIIYTIKVRESDLVLFVKGNTVDSLTPIMNNVLKLGSFLSFEFNESRDQFKLSMGRVKNLKFIKQ